MEVIEKCVNNIGEVHSVMPLGIKAGTHLISGVSIERTINCHYIKQLVLFSNDDMAVALWNCPWLINY